MSITPFCDHIPGDFISPPRGEEDTHCITCWDMLELFRVLGDDIRFGILLYLSETESDVSSLSKRLNLTIDRVSHALKILRNYNLVQATQVKKRRVYRLSPAIRFSQCACQACLCIHLRDNPPIFICHPPKHRASQRFKLNGNGKQQAGRGQDRQSVETRGSCEIETTKHGRGTRKKVKEKLPHKNSQYEKEAAEEIV